MKTVSFDDRAYDLLRGAKNAGDSFSDVVKRLLGGPARPIAASARGWSDMTDEELAALRRDTIGAFEPDDPR